jgi:hypothetical protein
MLGKLVVPAKWGGPIWPVSQLLGIWKRLLDSGKEKDGGQKGKVERLQKEDGYIRGTGKGRVAGLTQTQMSTLITRARQWTTSGPEFVKRGTLR